MKVRGQMNERIKLIYFLPCLGTGGSERIVFDLCRRLPRDLFDIEVLFMSEDVLANEIRSLGVPVGCISGEPTKSVFSKLLNYCRMLGKLRSASAVEMPVVFHTHHYSPLLQTFLVRKTSLRRFGWIHTEHNVKDVESSYSHPLYRRVNPLTGPDVATGVSDEVTRRMMQVSSRPAANCVTVLNGVDSSLYREEFYWKKRRELGLPDDSLVVGTVGNLRREKNQQLVLKAFSRVSRAFPQLHLVLCGDGDCRTDLERLASELGVAERVRFLGFRTDAHEIMSMLDVYCLPSTYEGLPLSILEAWAATKPVVATDVIGIRDIVRHDDNGLLVPPDGVESLAQALQAVLSDRKLAERLSASGNRLLLEKYDLHHMSGRYESLYREVAC